MRGVFSHIYNIGPLRLFPFYEKEWVASLEVLWRGYGVLSMEIDLNHIGGLLSGRLKKVIAQKNRD